MAAGRFRIVINPAYEYLREAIAAIPDTIAATGEVIYDARNTIYRAHIGGVDLTVKSFHVPAPLNRFVYTFLRPGKARRSYDNAMRLQALSIGTPEPIAYMEEYRGGLIARSYYVCRMFEGQNIRHWETDVDDYKSMLRAFAAFTLDLHRKGVLHKDYSPGNILFQRDTDGNYRFALVDINRMKFDVHDRRRLFRNFRCLNIDSEEETARVARYYAELSGDDPDGMGRMAVELLRGYHREKARHRRLKRLLGKKKK